MRTNGFGHGPTLLLLALPLLALLSLAAPLLTLPARAEIKRWPVVLDLTIGMKLADARAALARHKARFKERDDDKPLRKRSVKLKASFPDGAGVRRATLYFLDGRLWQLKLRPGEKLCRRLAGALGKSEGKRAAVTAWADRGRLRGAFCTREIAQLMDMSALVRAGIDRARVERDFERFAKEVLGR